ncbi:hypothetical protein FF1_033635 [Malus domestica]
MIKTGRKRASGRGYLLEPGPKAESALEAETLAGSEAKEGALEEGMTDATVVGIEFGGLGFGLYGDDEKTTWDWRL